MINDQERRSLQEDKDEAERRRDMDQRREDLRHLQRSAAGLRTTDQAGMHRPDAMGGRDATGRYRGTEQRGGETPLAGGPHRGKGPANYRRSDERIREEVCERLREDAHLDASGIEVAVQDRVVRLSGTVAGPQDAHRALLLAEAVSGATAVRSELQTEDGPEGPAAGGDW